MLSQRWMFKNAEYKNLGENFYNYTNNLNIHRWLNIANITPDGPDDGSVEPKHYSVDFSINLSVHVDYLVINFCTYCRIHHHHHVMPQARISLTLSRHFSLSFISSGRSSGLHPVSSNSCWMYVRVGRLAFARPYVGVHRSTSLMNSSLLLRQCPACLVRLAWIVFVMGGRWPYSWCLVGCCLVQYCSQHSCFFSSRLVSVQVVHPYSSIYTTAA